MIVAPSRHSVPPRMRFIFEAIVRLTDAVCAERLDDEYAQLCRALTAALCRKRPSPLRLVGLDAWACGVLYAIGFANFLFDRSQTPHMSKSTAAARAKSIRELFRMRQADPRWWRPSRLGENPLAWLIVVDGLVVDARTAPRELQQEALRLGLIPFMPGPPALHDEATRLADVGRRLEEVAGWCLHSPALTRLRRRARREFFGAADDRHIEYWAGTGDQNARQRRFVGWLMFAFRLPDGRRPAELAAEALYSSAEVAEVLDAVRRARYVLAIVRDTDGRQSTTLELEHERLKVHSSVWAQSLAVGAAVAAHLVPVGERAWVPGPGWLEWPVSIGPNMRRQLKQFQPDAIQVERLLQRNSRDEPEPASQDQPRDATLDAAVARMTAGAVAEGRSELVLGTDDWRNLVLQHMAGTDPYAFAREIVLRAGAVGNVDELNRWLALANNIWNATPQPDRGGKSANELMAQSPLPL